MDTFTMVCALRRDIQTLFNPYMQANSFQNSRYVFVFEKIKCVLIVASQLIPGHEAIGSIVEMGKNVKGFSIGDRCVADVGITVRRVRTHASASILTLIFSAMTASTAAAVNHSFAKTSTRAALLRTAVLLSTSPSESDFLFWEVT
jgi:hypothetical protein